MKAHEDPWRHVKTNENLWFFFEFPIYCERKTGITISQWQFLAPQEPRDAESMENKKSKPAKKIIR